MAALFGDDYSAGKGQCATDTKPPPSHRPPPTAHRSPFRHAPSTRRGLLRGAPKEDGLLRHRFAADPRSQLL